MSRYVKLDRTTDSDRKMEKISKNIQFQNPLILRLTFLFISWEPKNRKYVIALRIGIKTKETRKLNREISCKKSDHVRIMAICQIHI